MLNAELDLSTVYSILIMYLFDTLNSTTRERDDKQEGCSIFSGYFL